MTIETSGMSRPSSAIDVATKTFIFPEEKSSIISFCSFCLSPVFCPLEFCFCACPTKILAFICGISLSVS